MSIYQTSQKILNFLFQSITLSIYKSSAFHIDKTKIGRLLLFQWIYWSQIPIGVKYRLITDTRTQHIYYQEYWYRYLTSVKRGVKHYINFLLAYFCYSLDSACRSGCGSLCHVSITTKSCCGLVSSDSSPSPLLSSVLSFPHEGSAL